MKLLIVEDEKELSDSIVSYLRTANYICEVASRFNDAIARIENYEYDCIVLDIGLPDGSGLNLLKELKDNYKNEGVIILSAKNSIDDRITGLNMGADDYLSKPFHLPELSARIAAIIRRKKFTGNNHIIFHEIDIDTLGKQVRIQDQPVELTKKEYQLLVYFIANKGKVISKNAIAMHLWGDEMESPGNYDFIYTHIKNLRKKLEDFGCGAYIRSLYGMGYKFSEP